MTTERLSLAQMAARGGCRLFLAMGSIALFHTEYLLLGASYAQYRSFTLSPAHMLSSNPKQ